MVKLLRAVNRSQGSQRDWLELHLETLHYINYVKNHGHGGGDDNLKAASRKKAQISTGIRDESYGQDEQPAPEHKRRTFDCEKRKDDTVLGEKRTRAGRNTE